MSKIDVGRILDNIDDFLDREVHTIFFAMSVSLMLANYVLLHVIMISYSIQMYYPFVMLAIFFFVLLFVAFLFIATIGSVNYTVHEDHLYELYMVMKYVMVTLSVSLCITALCFILGYYTYLVVLYVVNSVLLGVLWVGGPTLFIYTYGPRVGEYFDKEE